MNRYDFIGRGAVVTGGAKGIGYATAELLLAGGATVCLWDRDEENLARAVTALGAHGPVEGIAVDVADPGSVAAGTEATLDICPTVDILIANAGIPGINKRAWEFTLEEWNRLIAADLTGVFLCCRALVPPMLARRYGRIVVVSSIAGLEGAADNAAYSAAKAGAIAYVKAIGKELAQSGVLVNCVAPSGIETDFLGGVTPAYMETVLARMPMGRLGQPVETAHMIAWLASEDCSFSTGAVFDNSGGRAVY